MTHNVLKGMKNKFLRFLFFELLMILFIIFKFFYQDFFWASQKMSNVLNRIFVLMSFFFERFLVFEIWSFLNWGFVKNLEEILAKYAGDANK